MVGSSKTLEFGPLDANDWLAQGIARFAEKDYAAAIVDLDKSLSLDGKNALALARRAEAHINIAINHNSKALVDADDAVRLAPDCAYSWSVRGKCWLNKGNLERAIADLTKSLHLDPQNVDAWCCKAEALFDQGDYEGALSDLTVALRLKRQLPRTLWLRGQMLYVLKRDYVQAAAECSEAIKLDPTLGEAFIVRGNSLRHLGHHEGAFADYNQAVKLMPANPFAYYSRGLGYHFSASFDLAISDFNHALRLFPHWPKAYLARARAFFYKGELPKAIADYTECIKRDSANVDALDGRAEAYESSGDYPNAAADKERVKDIEKHLRVGCTS